MWYTVLIIQEIMNSISNHKGSSIFALQPLYFSVFSLTFVLLVCVQEKLLSPSNSRRFLYTNRWPWSQSWRRLWRTLLMLRCVILQVSNLWPAQSFIPVQIHCLPVIKPNIFRNWYIWRFDADSGITNWNIFTCMWFPQWVQDPGTQNTVKVYWD